MTTSAPDLMNLMVQKMRYLNQKEAVHAENVANASTPGYRALEVKPFTFDDAMSQASIGMKVTDSRHIIPASMSGMNSGTASVKAYDATPNGNSVDAEQESMKVSQTNVQYQLVTSLYRKFAGLFKIALKGSAT